MSFILDALKKLEEKRQNETVPDLMTVHTEAPEEKSRPLFTYILTAVLVLNAVILSIWLLRPPKDEKSGLTVQAANNNFVNTAPAAKAEPATPKEVAPAVTAASTKPEDVPTSDMIQAEPLMLPLNPSGEELAALRKSIKEEQIITEAQQESTPTAENEAAAVNENGVIDMSRLPVSIKDGLPEITIKGHIYSNDPSSRLVNINGSIVREGGTVTGGLKVSEITVSGIVFDYSGLRFSMRAF